ncbi:hypothetical protein PG993_000421 [Apiospora rasikravindrae]|uniref:O-methyltransferase C-terminal domain-containing protein n=1 Tax=Apiospora rasikravindrae TaxID=990691 RepID=A0ABR1U8J3_9PEZI
MSHKQPEYAPFPLETLGENIVKNATIISQYLKSQNLPQPSLEVDGPTTLLPNDSPQCVRQARQDLLSAALQILNLTTGPSEYLPNLATGWLCEYDIFSVVPLTGTISYEDLATAAGVPEQRLKSITRMAMTSGLFREDASGKLLGHSATSKLFASNGDLYAYAKYMCFQSAPMAMQMTAASRQWGAHTLRPNETAYNVAFGTDLPFFDHIKSDEARTAKFAAYMRNVRSSEAVDLKHLVDGFEWGSILPSGLVVDVGGSTGAAAVALAKAFPQLSFIVQDLPSNVERGRKDAIQTLAAEVASRVAFQAHDFNEAQPTKGAEVYLLRMILHDWPDAAAVRIVHNLADAMDKKKSRLLIMDTVLMEPGELPLSMERLVRVRDLTMLQAFNSQERDLDSWQSLIGKVDPRLHLRTVSQPYGSTLSILEYAYEEMQTSGTSAETKGLREVQLSPWKSPGHVHFGKLTVESAQKASQLLTINHTGFHTRWKSTFHSTL